MKVKKIDAYLDGGTLSVFTDEGSFCVDGRMGSSTPNKLYVGAYPCKPFMSPISSEIEKLKIALKEYVEAEEEKSNIILANAFLKRL